MMKYKLVAMDLDGTLLNDEGVITNYTKDLLLDLSKKGIKIIIATGRSYSALTSKIECLNLSDPVICYNGAMIRNGKNDAIIMETSVPEYITRSLIDISRRDNVHFHAFMNGEFYYEKSSELSALYQDLSGLGGILTNLDTIPNVSATKVMFIGNEESLLKIDQEIRGLYGNDCYIAFSNPTFLEIMNKEASKAKALSLIAHEYGIKPNEIIAFGDGLNDQEMLEYAGKAIVMKNGFESLKAKFENSEYSNDEDGVARYLEKLINE